MEPPLDALEKLVTHCKLMLAGVREEDSVGEGKYRKGNIKGLLRSTSVWIYVDDTVSDSLAKCCIGRLVPVDDNELLTAMSALGVMESPPMIEEEPPVEPRSGGTIQDPQSTALSSSSTYSCFRLSLEEAFFMLHCLECLEIYEMEGGKASSNNRHQVKDGLKLKTTQECWSSFLDIQPKFFQSYVSYQHFRSQGYIVRSGIYYGCTHVLYSQHPSVAHASYCVLVILQESGNKTKAKDLLYEEMQALVRVSVNVAKKLVLLYVFCPTDHSHNPENQSKGTTETAKQDECDINDVNILPLVEVDEIKVTRWIPGDSEG